MRKIIPCILLVCLIVAVIFPTLSGVELGNKIVGKDSWIANQINTIKPLADAANFVSQTIQKIVSTVGEVIDAIVNFFKNPWGTIFKKRSKKMSLYQVFERFISFFTNGATIAPEVIQLVALALTLGAVFGCIIRPLYRLITRS